MNYVYFARDTEGLIKIGISNNPTKRMKDPPAELIGCVEGDRSLETSLHRKFSHIRAKGLGREWFLPKRELLRYIAGLNLITDVPSERYTTVQVPIKVYRAMRIASIRRGEQMRSISEKCWEAFKVAEGPKLHKRVRDSEPATAVSA